MKSVHGFGLGVVLLACCLVACNPRAGLPRSSAFEIGMTRAEVVARFGEPDDKRVLVRADHDVWGPIEGFWPGLPIGAEVEIWYYRSRAPSDQVAPELQYGTTELYFVDGSGTVRGRGFAPDNVNY